MDHRGGHVQKDIVVFKKKKKKKNPISFFGFSLFLSSFKHREFWISCLKSECLWGIFD